MRALSVHNLVKLFPGSGRGDREPVLAVAELSFDVEPGELFTILGPSGCGKTTALRCVAGLETPDGGEIATGERTLFSAARRVSVPASERSLGMVFQSYAIWPHMTVFANAAFPLTAAPRRRRPSRAQILERTGRTLAAVRLEHLAGRPATDLSGGEQQRLALARALVMEPALLLLDEPLSNLDARLREEMRIELRRLQRELGVTSVYVTHDQVEALSLSDRIAVMRAGRLEQIGTPREVYARPASQFVADFIGAPNLVPGVVAGPVANGLVRISTPGGGLEIPGGTGLPVGMEIVVVVRPEHVRLEPRAAGPANGGWPGVVLTQAFLGDSVDHVVDVAGNPVRVRTSVAGAVPSGAQVILRVDGTSCAVLRADE
jgi:iron(III) transport system ATP-binding protein